MIFLLNLVAAHAVHGEIVLDSLLESRLEASYRPPVSAAAALSR